MAYIKHTLSRFFACMCAFILFNTRKLCNMAECSPAYTQTVYILLLYLRIIRDVFFIYTHECLFWSIEIYFISFTIELYRVFDSVRCFILFFSHTQCVQLSTIMTIFIVIDAIFFSCSIHTS